jgi:RNA polymerase sigma-70 factor (ECF subfamily)
MVPESTVARVRTGLEVDRPELTSLMVAYQGGDLAAFDALYGRLVPLVRRYLVSVTRDPTWTDDLVQETFLQLHRSRRTYNVAYPVTPWVMAIARHVFLMGLRSRRRKGDFDRAPLAEPASGPAGGPAEAFVARDTVARGLSALSPGTRRAVWLHHVLGWPFKDVAATLRIGEAAAKLRASRGIARLRRALRGMR